MVSFVGVKRDITRELELEEQFFQAQKMEAVGQLAGGVAHDFNNLLQVIQGYGQMALEEARGSASHSDLEQVMKAADRATVLVRQLLAFSRKQVLELEELDLSAVVSDLAKMIQRIIGEDITFNIHSEPGLKMIRADRGQVEQILMNLCVNARDAMVAGGTLTIETGSTELDRDFQRAAMSASIPLIDTGQDQIGWMRSEAWQQISDILVDQGVIDAAVDVKAVYTNEFAEKAQ